MKIKISDILSEFVEEYNLHTFAHNGLVYFEIVMGYYGLPQSSNIINYLLLTRLNKSG